MKKWIVGFSILILLVVAGIYLFIPSTIRLTKSITATANQAAAHRLLSADSNWKKWWPVSSANEQAAIGLEAGDYHFQKTKTLFNSFEVAIEKNDHTLHSLLQLIWVNAHETKLTWGAVINAGVDPFTRVQRYFYAKKLGHQLDVILLSLKNYISDVEHLYEMDIREEKVQVEFLVSTKKTFNFYPGTKEIYAMLDDVKKYITQSQANENNYPMMHITRIDTNSYLVQVAIPVDKHVPDSGIFSSKRMLKNGDILVAEVVGGKNTTDLAMRKMDLYLSDHQYSNVALPFQSLVTDRTKETDTSKWKTKIYYPVR